MLVHFVCRGNTFRSRMAEAYLRSKFIPGVEVISSGVEASRNVNGPVTWEAERIIKRYHLIDCMKQNWTQTTKELLKQSDYVIFLDRSVYHDSVKHFGFHDRDYEVWDIEDIDESAFVKTISLKNEIRRIKESEHIFEMIMEKVNGLSVDIKRESIPQ